MWGRGLFEPVSYQDLIVTPLIGSLLGEFAFSPLRDYIRSKPGGPDSVDKVVLILTDPLGAANELIDGLFGVATQVSFAPIARARLLSPAARPWATSGWGVRDGVRQKGVWGLRIEVRW